MTNQQTPKTTRTLVVTFKTSPPALPLVCDPSVARVFRHCALVFLRQHNQSLWCVWDCEVKQK